MGMVHRVHIIHCAPCFLKVWHQNFMVLLRKCLQANFEAKESLRILVSPPCLSPPLPACSAWLALTWVVVSSLPPPLPPGTLTNCLEQTSTWMYLNILEYTWVMIICSQVYSSVFAQDTWIYHHYHQAHRWTCLNIFHFNILEYTTVWSSGTVKK